MPKDLIDLYTNKELFGKLKIFLYGYLDEVVLDEVYEGYGHDPKFDGRSAKEYLDRAFEKLEEIYKPVEEKREVTNEAR